MGSLVPSLEPEGEEPPIRRTSLPVRRIGGPEGPVIEAVQAPAVVRAAPLQTRRVRRPLLGCGTSSTIPGCDARAIWAASSLKQPPSIAPQFGDARVVFPRIRSLERRLRVEKHPSVSVASRACSGARVVQVRGSRTWARPSAMARCQGRREGWFRTAAVGVTGNSRASDRFSQLPAKDGARATR